MSYMSPRTGILPFCCSFIFSVARLPAPLFSKIVLIKGFIGCGRPVTVFLGPSVPIGATLCFCIWIRFLISSRVLPSPKAFSYCFCSTFRSCSISCNTRSWTQTQSELTFLTMLSFTAALLPSTCCCCTCWFRPGMWSNLLLITMLATAP